MARVAPWPQLAEMASLTLPSHLGFIGLYTIIIIPPALYFDRFANLENHYQQPSINVGLMVAIFRSVIDRMRADGQVCLDWQATYPGQMSRCVRSLMMDRQME